MKTRVCDGCGTAIAGKLAKTAVKVSITPGDAEFPRFSMDVCQSCGTALTLAQLIAKWEKSWREERENES